MKFPKHIVERSIEEILKHPVTDLLIAQDAAKQFALQHNFSSDEVDTMINSILNDVAGAFAIAKSNSNYKPPTVHVDVIPVSSEKFMESVREFFKKQ